MIKKLKRYFSALLPRFFRLGNRIPIYIGWDSREEIASSICAYSIQKQTTAKVRTIFLKQLELQARGFYWRDHDPLASTEFTYTRFLVPALEDFSGFSLFLDGDFLFLDDIQNLLKLCDSRFAVQVVKHDYAPAKAIKKKDFPQSIYPRKNWSSLIIWNNAHPKNRFLTPQVVNQSKAEFLHQFGWLSDEDIGALPVTWNWLVNWHKEPQDGKPKAVHFTEGGPWLEGHRENPYVGAWDAELAAYLGEQYKSLHSASRFQGRTWEKHLPALLEVVPDIAKTSILDFGCGPLGGISSYLPSAISYDPHVSRYTADPWHRHYDVVFSCDVLEHLSLAQVDSFIANVQRSEPYYCYLVISLRLAVKTFSDGSNVHITVRDSQWWTTKITSAFGACMAVNVRHDPKADEITIVLRRNSVPLQLSA